MLAILFLVEELGRQFSSNVLRPITMKMTNILSNEHFRPPRTFEQNRKKRKKTYKIP